ncbi:HEAT repeat domain-containing protein [Nocardia sp. NPDC050793]|uniref:HEAT repeat domain-containing protein n=1 Tax=Nocardia sp. NPDC050793 TaxID=3155159 RepID=UPI0033E7C19C
MDGVDAQLSRIVDKLTRAAADPGLLEAFGARTHGFRLNPPLSESTVAAFETEHDVVLPEGYRRFLLEIADGGAGPSYGLLELAEAYGEVADCFTGYLAEPSPFVPGIAYSDDWWNRFSGQQDRPDPLQGTLSVVHHGCTSYTQLVISGPGRGRLVAIDHNGVPAPYVLEDPDFLTWYERWLDELLAGYNVDWFSDKLPGDEAILLGILSADPSAERRARAATSLQCLPRLSAAAIPTLAAAVADPSVLVRATVLGCAWRSKIPIDAAARTALNDPDASVRAEAISVLRVLGTPDLAERARALFEDHDTEVTRQAMWALAESGDLTVADLAPLVARPDPRTRASALYYLAETHGDATDLIARAFADEQPQVRRQAIQTAELRDDRVVLPLLQRRIRSETDTYVLANLHRVISAWTDTPSTTRTS